MAKFYAPNFSGLLPLFDGKSAGGKLYAYRAGSSIPAPLFDEDGVELGSWVSIDSNGCADFLLDSALSYKLVVKDALGAVVGEWDNVKATNASGMENPMENPGDIIVGGTGGTATALPVGANGEVLTSDGTTASWAAPAAQPGDHLVKASATDTSDPGSLNDKLAVLSPVIKNTIITPQGDEKLLLGICTSGVTDGYVLTKGMTGADWAAPATQPGDHKLLVSATDAAEGYLGAKLTAGSNITLTTNTDGDGVQSIEISAAGGGGVGCADVLDWSLGSSAMCYNYSQPNQNYTYIQAFLAARKGTPKGIFIAAMNGYSWANTTVRVGLYNYDFNSACAQLCYGQLSSTANPSGDVLFVPFTDTTQEIVMGKRLWLAFCLTARGNVRIPYVQVNESSFNRFKTTVMASGDTLSVAGSSGWIQGYECGVYY